MEHRGKAVTNVVSQPVGNHVIGVKIASRPVILPKLESIEPPVIPRCFDRHVIRTSTCVVIVEVAARVKVMPLSVPFSAIVETAREELDAALKEDGSQPSAEDYKIGLRVIANRMAWKLRKQGIVVEDLK